jgi:hypothetical protein
MTDPIADRVAKLRAAADARMEETLSRTDKTRIYTRTLFDALTGGLLTDIESAEFPFSDEALDDYHVGMYDGARVLVLFEGDAINGKGEADIVETSTGLRINAITIKVDNFVVSKLTLHDVLIVPTWEHIDRMTTDKVIASSHENRYAPMAELAPQFYDIVADALYHRGNRRGNR